MPRSKGLARGFRDVRYPTRNVERSLAFYTRLGFRIDAQELPAFAQASMGGLTLFLTLVDPEARPVLDDRRPKARKAIVLEVEDLPAHIESLKSIGFRFRNEMKEGPGGRQIRLEDPDGNPVDLCETARRGRAREKGGYAWGLGG